MSTDVAVVQRGIASVNALVGKCVGRQEVTDEPFYSIGDGLRRMYLESPYDTVEEFLASLECPDFPEPMQFPRY